MCTFIFLTKIHNCIQFNTNKTKLKENYYIILISTNRFNFRKVIKYYCTYQFLLTFWGANGSFCSCSRYFSMLKKVSKNIFACLHFLRSDKDILSPLAGFTMSNICCNEIRSLETKCTVLLIISKKNVLKIWFYLKK